MKSQIRIFIIAIFPFLLMSCQDDEEQATTWISLGEVQNDYNGSGETVIQLDNGEVLIPTNTIPHYDDDERIALSFSNYEEGAAEFEATVYNTKDVLTKDIVKLTEENEEELGNDPIHVHEQDIWISDKYLNIYFEYLGSGYVSHFINMATDEENKYDKNGRLILTFKHNAYHDYMHYWFPGLVSFDMESLREGNETSVDFVVLIKDYDKTIVVWEDTYEFGAENKSSHHLKDIPTTETIK